jgi:arginyl-tRNA synthetase
MEALGPHMFRLVVHYKEAVRERKRMRLFTTYWEAEENNRRGTLLHCLYQDAENQFTQAEHESQALLVKVLEKHSPAAVASDAKFIASLRDSNKKSLKRTDVQLDLFKDHVQKSQLFRSSTDDLGKKPDVPGACLVAS